MTTSAPVPPSPDFRTRLNAALRELQAPVVHDSAWIGPFEQLAGAVFSLIEARKEAFPLDSIPLFTIRWFNAKSSRF